MKRKRGDCPECGTWQTLPRRHTPGYDRVRCLRCRSEWLERIAVRTALWALWDYLVEDLASLRRSLRARRVTPTTH